VRPTGCKRMTGPVLLLTHFLRLMVSQFRIRGFHLGDTGANPVKATNFTVARLSSLTSFKNDVISGFLGFMDL